MNKPQINPITFKTQEDINNIEMLKKIPLLINEDPENYKKTNTFFVDSSGFGQEDEIALTINQFIDKLKIGFSYGIVDSGQFQVYINEYKKDYSIKSDVVFLKGSYKKARVIKEDNNLILISYNTRVCIIDKYNKPKILNDFFDSRTTRRHIKQFLEENGFNYNEVLKNEG